MSCRHCRWPAHALRAVRRSARPPSRLLGRLRVPMQCYGLGELSNCKRITCCCDRRRHEPGTVAAIKGMLTAIAGHAEHRACERHRFERRRRALRGEVGELSYGVYASPSYLDRHGKPDFAGGRAGSRHGANRRGPDGAFLLAVHVLEQPHVRRSRSAPAPVLPQPQRAAERAGANPLLPLRNPSVPAPCSRQRITVREAAVRPEVDTAGNSELNQ